MAKGRQQREWIHARDHCRALLALWQRGELGEAYNIGTCLRLTNLQICRAFIKNGAVTAPLCLGTKPLPLLMTAPGHDIRYALDGSKIRESLQWRPSVSWRDGIAETVQSYL